MPDARDPRTDPRPGDVLEAISGPTIRVGYVSNGYVVFVPVGSTTPSDLTHPQWRELARNARVVARGAGDDT